MEAIRKNASSFTIKNMRQFRPSETRSTASVSSDSCSSSDDAHNVLETKPYVHVNPFALFSNEQLAPRSLSWMYISALSLAGSLSLLSAKDTIDDLIDDDEDDHANISKYFTLSLFLQIVSFALSFLVTISYRHRTFRDCIASDFVGSLSLEFISSIILFSTICIMMKYTLIPYPGLDFGLTTVNEGYEYVWNARLWLSIWLIFPLSTKLVGDLMMASLDQKKGTITAGIGDARIHDASIGLTYWFVSMTFSAALIAFSADMKKQESCIVDTSPCTQASLGISVGLLGILLSFLSFALYRLDQMGAFDEWGSETERRLSLMEAALCALQLAVNLANVAYGGSNSSQVGNVFVCSWMGLLLSLLLCERTVNALTPRMFPPKSSLTQHPVSTKEVELFDMNEEEKDYLSLAPSYSCSSYADGSSSSVSSTSSSLSYDEYQEYHKDFGSETDDTQGSSASYSPSRCSPNPHQSQSSMKTSIGSYQAHSILAPPFTNQSSDNRSMNHDHCDHSEDFNNSDPVVFVPHMEDLNVSDLGCSMMSLGDPIQDDQDDFYEEEGQENGISSTRSYPPLSWKRCPNTLFSSHPFLSRGLAPVSEACSDSESEESANEEDEEAGEDVLSQSMSFGSDSSINHPTRGEHEVKEETIQDDKIASQTPSFNVDGDIQGKDQPGKKVISTSPNFHQQKLTIQRQISRAKILPM